MDKTEKLHEIKEEVKNVTKPCSSPRDVKIYENYDNIRIEKER